MKRLRTLQQILKEIKQDDPNSCVTKYMIRALDTQGKLAKVYLGNKILYDLDQVLSLLGLI
ncbi:MAG: hypothetical protein K2N65_04850 [Anaeroplasmataceae bacterium]|nr:hypothetical protein [Anaeroplasmataceae bacterium]